MNKVFWPRLSFYNQHRIEIGLNKSVEVFLEVDWLQKLPKKEDQCEEVTFYFVLQSISHCQSVIMPEQYNSGHRDKLGRCPDFRLSTFRLRLYKACP